MRQIVLFLMGRERKRERKKKGWREGAEGLSKQILPLGIKTDNA